tara:strand:+ start:303 stop:743 length:441 start_codon:yes stop_codon:yes gene_type:complete
MSENPYYETMYILRPDIPEEEVDSHLKKYSELLEKSGTEVLDSQMRGKRRLAYPIDKHKEGIYVQLSHKGNGQQVATLERAMRLSEDVIRYLTVKQYGPLPTPKSPAKDDEAEKTDTEKKDVKLSEDKTETPADNEKKEDPKESSE